VDPAAQLFNRSLLENALFGNEDVDPLRVGEALRRASLSEVLAKLPHGLQTPLGEGGGLLSGGEGQRVRLARAACREDVRLAILDEPFRGLERERRRELLATARELWRDVTLLCVTHDLEETRDFDRVLVVEGGRVVESGSPAELLADASRYRELIEAERELAREVWGEGWRRVDLVEGTIL
jgi:ABC-type multidrug transport system fused ATPase/permease subunit